MMIAYLESILVASKMEQEHLTIVTQVATGKSRLQLKLIKLKKCAFCLLQVEYLDIHIISKEGLRPAASKVKTIKEVPKPS